MLYNHAGSRTGCSPDRLQFIFRTYIFPQFQYGTPLWIFDLRERFRYDEPLVHGYGKYWRQLRGLYRECARYVLVIHSTTSGESALVRYFEMHYPSINAMPWKPWRVIA